MSEAVAGAWQAWLAENLLRGASPEQLVAPLVAAGLDRPAAESAVASVRASPLLAGARRMVTRSAGVEQAVRLRRWLGPGALAERSALDEGSFHADFWQVNRPVVIRGAAARWAALQWSLSGWAETLGDVSVEAMAGRCALPPWRRQVPSLVQRMPLRELALHSLEGTGDEVYCVARNELLGQAGLAHLARDLGTLPGLDSGGAPRLWVGPRDVSTAVHHDQSSGWFVQLVGRKELWLASNLEPELWETARGLYNEIDPTDPPVESEVVWHHTVLDPGDAVFLPVGWWHALRALDPCISVSFGQFVWPNNVTWYLPGRSP